MVKGEGRNLFFIVVLLVSAIVFSFVAGLAFSTIGYMLESILMAEIFARIGQVLALLGFFIVWYRNILVFRDFGLFPSEQSNHLKMIAAGLAMGLIMQFIILLAFKALGAEIRIFDDKNFINILFLGIIPAILIHFCVSIYEELIFRGFLLTRLKEITGIYLAVSIQSILFSLLHFSNSGYGIMAFIGLALFGFFLGIVRIGTVSLWFPISFHFMWNLAQGSIFGFAVSGQSTISILDISNLHSKNSLLFGGVFGPEASLITILLLVLCIIISIFWFRPKKALCQH